MELKDLSDKDLLQELARRKEEKRQARIDANNKKLELLRKVLTREMLDALLPEHGRTSCSDDNRVNGFRCHRVRCTRCALLDFLEDEYTPSSQELVVNIYFQDLPSDE